MTFKPDRRDNVQGTVYLIHFVTPYQHARHYLGWTEGPLELRIGAHRAGKGARLMAVVQAAGIDWLLARTWPGETRNFERKLKNEAHIDRHCPVCRAKDRSDQ